MSEPRIETWFPKSIYIREDFSLDLLADIETTIKERKIETIRDQELFVDSTHRTDRELHKELDCFKTLSNRIEDEIRQFMYSLGYAPNVADLAFIAGMWYNTSNKGDFVFPHNHAGSVISGAFYVKAAEENKIIFYDNLNDLQQPVDYPNELSFATVNYQCVPGRLLLWRSNLVHGTPVQLQPGEKIVISFNALIRTSPETLR